MSYKSIGEIIENLRKDSKKKRLVVAGADEVHTLEAIVKAKKEDLIHPILVGDKSKIIEILGELGEGIQGYEVIDNTEDPIQYSVKLIQEKKADILMKGNVQTSTLIKSVLNKEYGIMNGELLSHVLFVQTPAYHKVFAVTDSAIVPNPDITQKKAILNNTLEAMHNLGYDNPKVAVITAVEVVNPKMQETLDAAEMVSLNQNGEIADCVIEGPISMDIAFDTEAAATKGFESVVSGDPDILLMPNLLAANIAVKTMRLFGKSTVAGIVLGAKVPIVLTSRSTSTLGKYMSIALSAAVSKEID